MTTVNRVLRFILSLLCFGIIEGKYCTIDRLCWKMPRLENFVANLSINQTNLVEKEIQEINARMKTVIETLDKQNQFIEKMMPKIKELEDFYRSQPKIIEGPRGKDGEKGDVGEKGAIGQKGKDGEGGGDEREGTQKEKDKEEPGEDGSVHGGGGCGKKKSKKSMSIYFKQL